MTSTRHATGLRIPTASASRHYANGRRSIRRSRRRLAAAGLWEREARAIG